MALAAGMTLQRFRVDVARLIRAVLEPFTVLLIYSEWIRCNPFTVVAYGCARCSAGLPVYLRFYGWWHGAQATDICFQYMYSVYVFYEKEKEKETEKA